jgi:putative intracellular protease/amidase
MNKKEVIFVLLNEYADWESSFLASALHGGIQGDPTKYCVKTLALTKEPVQSFGGFYTLPDYDINSLPEEYSALVLIGANHSWHTEEAKQIIPLIETTLSKNLVLAAICDASVFLGLNGFLNVDKHTSNTIELLKTTSESKYSGEKNYLKQQAVRDGKLITANGTGYLEFTKEVSLALEVYSPEQIETYYNTYKHGYYEMLKKTK